MYATNECLSDLCKQIKEREQRIPLSFEEFLAHTSEVPERVFRNIFQTFHDMIYSYIGNGVDDAPDDPESIKYIYYDCAPLFEEDTDQPFFADRLFANRLINHISSFRRSIRQNRIYIFEGPHGCGKSTFINNLLSKFEKYSKTEEGASYETVWHLNKKDLRADTEGDSHQILSQLRSLVDNSGRNENQKSIQFHTSIGRDYIDVPCPSHDHPLLLIPKDYRKPLFEKIIKDEVFKEKLFTEKQYEWVFKDQPCTICMSLFQALLDMSDSPDRVFDMIFARRYLFNRRLGEGLRVFNPGDRLSRRNVSTNQLIQNQLNSMLKDSDRVHYLYSRYASTNNGIHVLMDVKASNKERLANLHGIISEGLHRVEDIEENVNSLFLVVMNPEDRENIADTQSFSDRITTIKVTYVLDYNTEVKIYKNFFGDQITDFFLPGILENFAKIVLSTRLGTRSKGIEEWIGVTRKYQKFCDSNFQLLKMDLYGGAIPSWLSEEDRKSFNAKRRRRIIGESENEGNRGYTGRDSLKIFNEFISAYGKKDKLITMPMLTSFFKKKKKLGDIPVIPDGFISSLQDLYNYTVLEQVKESLYYYNEERISKEIQNYLFAINFEVGSKIKCVYTGEEIEVTEDFLQGIELRILGSDASSTRKHIFREGVQSQYTSETLTHEILLEGKTITETQLFQDLYKQYVHNLKENVLVPFLKNANFRNAIIDYGTEPFKTYDKRIGEDVTLLIENLKKKYGYTEQGAKEMCIYVIDNDLAFIFSDNNDDDDEYDDEDEESDEVISY